jgi:transposase
VDVIHRRCAGLDVHKKSVMACVRLMSEDGKVTKRVRRFGTMTHELRNLHKWLASQGVVHVAMESTGVYWKPLWNVLEEGPFELLLCNARDVKNVPGRKTDVKDCEWIAQLLQHGLLRGSFVPSRGLRNLRDLTRARTKLIEAKTANANRLQKTLEDANIKLASVASDPLGKSGRAMIEAIIRGEDDPKKLAELAKQTLRAKIPQLRFALEGRVTEHHRFMLRLQYDEILHLEGVIAKLDDRIAEVMGTDSEGTVPRDDNLLLFPDPEDPRQDDDPLPDPPGGGSSSEKQPPSRREGPRHRSGPSRDDSVHSPRGSVSPFGCLAPAVHLLCSIPGIKQRTAENVLAEIGCDMSQFPTAGHLTSWAGLSPGNNESAGKRRSGKTTKGNKFLKRALTQAAWVAGRTKGTYFSAQYRRLASRRGKKRAIVAVARSLLVTIYYMLERGVYYEELGADYFDRLNSERLTRYHVKRLTDLGYDVTLDDAA